MSSSLAKLGVWLARKAVLSAVVAAAGFATVGLWLFVHDTDGYASTPEELRFRWMALQLTAHISEGDVASLDAVVAGEERRAALADRVIRELQGMDNLWDRLVANPEQQELNDVRLAQMKIFKKEIAATLLQLRRAQVAGKRELAGIEARRDNLSATLMDRRQGFSPVRHYAREAWRLGRGYVAAALAAYLLGPTLVCLGFYYLLAPLVTRGRPLRLADGQWTTVTAAASQPAVEVAVWPGEILLARKAFIAPVDSALTRKTRSVLSWRFPFSSLACGLANLAAVRNVRSTGGRRVVLAGRGKAPVQFTVVDVPEGGSLVVRPGFLAGVLCPSGHAPVIRSHLRLFCWQAWVAGQFRFWEFTGPCRIVLATCQALRAEALVQTAEVATPAARVRQEAVVGFTPGLECRPVRAVSFWRYYLGASLLFEAGFFGSGLVVHAASSVRGRVRKLFGL